MNIYIWLNYFWLDYLGVGKSNFRRAAMDVLTFVGGHVPQRRVAGISLALTFIEAPFNPALC